MGLDGIAKHELHVHEADRYGRAEAACWDAGNGSPTAPPRITLMGVNPSNG
ncbi:MAG TPA: hypothetical protein VGG83_00490 [Trebonia sp.]